MPKGAKLTKKTGQDYHEYSYSKSLPGGGSISSVDISSGYGGKVIMRGTDNNGVRFTTSYIISSGNIQHSMSNPKFTSSDLDILYELGVEFSKSYGYRS